MSKQANLLQESIERLEAGETLEVSQKFLPAEEQDTLSLVSRLRSAAWPRPNPHTVEQQRKRIRGLYTQEAKMESHNRSSFNLFKDWRLPALISVTVVALLACGLVTILGIGGAVWFGVQQANESLPPEVDIVEQEAPVEVPEAVEQLPETADQPLESYTSDEVLTPFEALNPHEALLTDYHGLVEIKVDESWQVILEDRVLMAGAQLRTGSFSSASLRFKDGSVAQIGPNSKISIKTLAADLANQSREIRLKQWSGESSHSVVPLTSANTSYQVDTPSGQGQVTGTQFHLRIATEQTLWYVDDGAVEVSGEDKAVQVSAGKMTAVTTDEEPTDPVHFITGQGVVTIIGEEWMIADQSYQTHEHTIIIGNPQVGDLVFFEGHLLEDESRVVDLIVLVRRNPANTFTLTGEVQTMDATLWTVNFQTIAVTDLTDVEPGIEEGDLVRVKGIILGDGSLQAEEIHLIPDGNGTPFEFTGVVQQIEEDSWLIMDIPVAIDENTAIDEGLVVGDIVRVQGWTLDDDTWLATSITRSVDEDSAFEFVGYLDSIDPWVVAGIPIETREWTAIDPDLELDELVRVSGQIQADGTLLAFEIRRYDEALLTILIGRVFSIDPWVVSGLELNVDDETIIEGEILVGMLVRVELQLFPDGTHKVIRITPFDDFDWESSCQYLVVTVISVDEDEIVLEGWPSLPLSEEAQIEGDIQPGSIVQTMICYDEDMNVVVVYILVLDEPELPPPVEGVKGEKVTVCHKPNSKKPHTIVISSSALPAHLGHGDTLGPCP